MQSRMSCGLVGGWVVVAPVYVVMMWGEYNTMKAESVILFHVVGLWMRVVGLGGWELWGYPVHALRWVGWWVGRKTFV